jgi:hypothetical protein
VCAHDRIVDAATAEEPAVNLRMQRLDPAVHDLRKAGVCGHLLHRDALLLQQRGGAAGGEQLYTALL